MRYQDLNGVDGWFQDAADAASEFVTYGLSTSFNWASEKADELTDEAKAKLADFQKKELKNS